MYVERAAHVDCPVTHSASGAQVGLALIGAVIGGLVVASTGVGIIAIVAGAATGAMRGLKGGKIVDAYRPPAEAGKVKTGLHSVRLGKEMKDAARAFQDTTVDCHGKKVVAMGSESVLLGGEYRPMSRRFDKTQCQGVISNGLPSVLVGGEPTEVGIDPEEAEAFAVTLITSLATFASAPDAIKEGGLKALPKVTAEVTGAAAKLAGNEKLEKAAGQVEETISRYEKAQKLRRLLTSKKP